MKKLLKISILLLLFVPWQKVAGQADIIMGTTSFVGNIQGQDDWMYFYDPGGTGYFGQGLQDTITLRTGIGGTQLYVFFEEFSMGDGDTLWIFDGDATQCDINHLRGYYNLVNSPREVLAIGREMTFVFHSDSMDIQGLQDGWKAQVYAYNPQPEEYNYGFDMWLNTCNAVFYDAGGPNGYINANGTPPNSYTQFTSPLGTHIKCHFTQFQVSGVLKIYDGLQGDPNQRLIGQFCNNTLNNGQDTIPTFFSSTNTLCFEYVSGSSDNNKPGWRADISCVPELFESEDGNPCPSITNKPGGLYTNSPDPRVIEYNCANPVVVLQAEVIATGQYTSDYKVEQIPFNSYIFPFDSGEVVDADFDDQWLEGVPLGFTFMFFGENYTTVYPGTNGLISMTPMPHPQSASVRNCSWHYGTPPPSPPYTNDIPNNQVCGSGNLETGNLKVPYNYNNCIYGVYEDIDCSVPYNSYSFNTLGAVRKGVLGSAPCRAFVFNFLNVALYEYDHSNPSRYNSYQIAMYEGTNIIDVYVKHRKCCASTNGNDEGIIGLQNKTSSQILLAPGYGKTGWEADDVAWRFTPITPLDETGSLTWYKDSLILDPTIINDPHIISYDPTAKTNRIITVRPTDTTKIYSVYRYKNALGADMPPLIDSTIINVNIPKIKPVSSNGNTPVCPGDSVFLTVEIDPSLNINPALYGGYTWSSSQKDTFAIDTVCAPVGIDTATYYVTVKFENSCTRRDSVKVAITELVMPTITGRNAVSDTDSICLGKSYTLEATHPDTNKFKWSTVADNTIFNDKDTVITVSPQITTDYVATATMVGDCDVSDTFTVVVMPLPQPSFTAYPTEIFVENGIGSVQCTNTSDDYPQLIWNFGDAFSNVNIIQDLNEPTHDYTRSGFYTITMTAIDTFGCVDSVKARVSVKVPYFFYIPNAFTPDGDGLNERFAPQGEGVDPDNYSMQIFDRSGLLIFSTRNPYDYWDGRNKHGQMCPEGVYVYKIKLINLNGEEMEYPGTVTLVR